MKTKIKRLSKRSLASFMAVLMLVTCMVVGQITTVNAADITSSDEEPVYMYWNPTPSSANWWNNDSRGKYIYVQGSNGTAKATADYVTIGSTNYYRVRIPNGTWNKFVLYRSNSQNGSWNNHTNNEESNKMQFDSNNNYISDFGENWSTPTWGTNVCIAPTGDFTPSSDEVDAGDTVSFTSTVAGTYTAVDSHTLTVTGGTGATVNGMDVTFANSGTFTVTDTIAYHAKGYSSISSTMTKTSTITVNVPEVAKTVSKYYKLGDAAAVSDGTESGYTSRTTTVTADQYKVVDNVKYVFSSWTYSGNQLSNVTVDNNSRTITYKASSDGGSITANYTAVPCYTYYFKKRADKGQLYMYTWHYNGSPQPAPVSWPGFKLTEGNLQKAKLPDGTDAGTENIYTGSITKHNGDVPAEDVTYYYVNIYDKSSTSPNVFIANNKSSQSNNNWQSKDMRTYNNIAYTTHTADGKYFDLSNSDSGPYNASSWSDLPVDLYSVSLQTKTAAATVTTTDTDKDTNTGGHITAAAVAGGAGEGITVYNSKNRIKAGSLAANGVTVTAHAHSGYSFTGWSFDGGTTIESTQTSYVVTANAVSTLTAVFGSETYSVTKSGDNFTLTTYSDSGRTTEKSTFEYGETVYYRLTPVTNYRISSVTVGANSPITVTGNYGDYDGSFTISGNTTITASAVRYYQVTLTGDGGIASYTSKIGSAAATAYTSGSSLKVDTGSTVVFTVAYATGYQYSSNSNNITHTNDTTFTMSAVSADKNATVTSTKTSYTISKAETSHGTFAVQKSGSDVGSANYGDQITVVPNPNSGYSVSSVKYNDGTDHNVSLSSGQYKFTMPSHNVTVSVTFAETLYTVTVQSADNTKGTVASASVSAGSITQVTLPTASANTGYEFSTWQITSGPGTLTNATSADSAKITASGAVTVQAVFVEAQYDVTVTSQVQGANALGNVSPVSGKAGITHGLSVSATARTGYTFVNWTGAGLNFTNANSSSTTITTSSGGTATANFKPNTFYLDFTNSTDWNAQTNPAARYAAYFDVSSDTSKNEWVNMSDVSAEPNIKQVTIPTTYAYDRVVFCRMNGSNNTNNWSNRWNQTVEVSIAYNKNKYTIPNNNKANYGGTEKYNGGSWDTDAYFPPVARTITLSNSGHGTLTVTDVYSNTSVTSGTISVAEGRSFTIEATADSGYMIGSISVGGVPIAAAASKLTYSGSQNMGGADVTVEVQFVPRVPVRLYYLSGTQSGITGDNVHAYVWNGSGPNAAWPGADIHTNYITRRNGESNTKYYYFEFYEDQAYENVIFNIGSSDNQTDTIPVMSGGSYLEDFSGYYYWTGSTTAATAWAPIPEDLYLLTGSLSHATLTEPATKTYHAGDTINLTVTPDSGYEFVSGNKIRYSTDGGSTYSDLTTTLNGDGTLSATISSAPAADIKIATTASTPTKIQHTVSTSCVNGTISVNSPVAIGDTMTVTVTPTSGYELTSITAVWATGGETITLSGTGNSRTYVVEGHSASNISITATCSVVTPVLSVQYKSAANTNSVVTSGEYHTGSQYNNIITFTNAASFPNGTAFKIKDGSTDLVSGTVGSTTASKTTDLAAGTHVLKAVVTFGGVDYESDTVTLITHDSNDLTLVQPSSQAGTISLTYSDIFGVQHSESTAATYSAATGTNATVSKNSGSYDLADVLVNDVVSPTTFTVSENATVTAEFYSNYYLLGLGSENWSTTNTRRFKFSSDDNVLILKLDLTRDNSYTAGENTGFKIVTGSTYYGKTSTTIRDKTSGWIALNTETSGNSSNIGFYARTGGVYEFRFTTDTFNLNVTEPKHDYTISDNTSDAAVHATRAGANTAKNGSTYEFSITADAGYRVTSVTAQETGTTGYQENVTVTHVSGNNYSLTMPCENILITVATVKTYEVSFSKDAHITGLTLTVPSGSYNEGSYTPGDSPVVVDAGTNISFTATYAEGYEWASGGSASGWTYNDDHTSISYANVQADITLNLTSVATDFTITTVASPNNTPAGNTITADKATANIGETVTLTITTVSGYYMINLSDDAHQAIDFNEDGGGNGDSYTVTYTMPARNVTITATFSQEFGTKFYVDMHDNPVFNNSTVTDTNKKVHVAVYTDSNYSTKQVDHNGHYCEADLDKQGTSTVFMHSIPTPLSKTGTSYNPLYFKVTYGGNSYNRQINSSDLAGWVSGQHEIWLEAVNESSLSLHFDTVDYNGNPYVTESSATGKRVYLVRPKSWTSNWKEVGIVTDHDNKIDSTTRNGNHCTYMGEDDDYRYFYSDINSSALQVQFQDWETNTTASASTPIPNHTDALTMGNDNFFELYDDNGTVKVKAIDATEKLKRLYFAKPSSISGWDKNVGVYYWGDYEDITWKYGVHMSYFGNDSSGTRYYFADVPKFVDNIIFQNWGDNTNPGSSPSAKTDDIMNIQTNTFFTLTKSGNSYNVSRDGIKTPAKYTSRYSAAEMNVGENENGNIKIAPKGYDANKNTVTYSSANSSKVSVDDQGVIVPLQSTMTAGVNSPVDITVTIKGELGGIITTDANAQAHDYFRYTTSVTVHDTGIFSDINIMSLSSNTTTISIPKQGDPAVNPAYFGADSVTAVVNIGGVKYNNSAVITPDNTTEHQVTGNDSNTYTDSYTVKYAAQNNTFTGYSIISVLGKVVSTSIRREGGERFGFAHWNVNGSENSSITPSLKVVTGVETATTKNLALTGQTYEAIYQSYIYVDVDFTFNYYVYNTTRKEKTYDSDGNFAAWQEAEYYQYDKDYVGDETFSDGTIPDTLHNAEFDRTVHPRILKTFTVDDYQVSGVNENTVTADNLRSWAVKAINNMPENDYYDYSVTVGGITIDKGTAGDYKATATVNLTQTPKKYKVWYNGTQVQTGSYENDFYYQEYVTLSNNNVDTVWYKSDKTGTYTVTKLATGSEYKFRVKEQECFIKSSGTPTDDDKKNRSVIDYVGSEISYDSNKEILTNNFYIADFFDASKVLNERNYQYEDVEFVGGGVMYYSRTNRVVNPNVVLYDFADSNGIGKKDNLASFIQARIEENRVDSSVTDSTDISNAIAYGTEIPPTIYKDGNRSTGLIYRYKPFKKYRNRGGSVTKENGEFVYNISSDVFRFSNAMKAYQYIYASPNENKDTNEGKEMRVYSYYVYSYTDYNKETDVPETVYKVIISDNYSDASTYWANPGT